MIYTASPWAIVIFTAFVVTVLAISFYFANKTKSSSSYFAAGGSIHWSVNGIAFAGDYLSAASFLGICGMIAFYGYDGFLYSIGYLAGWIVALFVVAEPMKRLGKFTFTDALDAKFNSRSIKLVSAISTLIVSIFYLIPQMVGAGALVTPLLGLSHEVGVFIVGTIVVLIVATAGMTSTTYVQFLKAALLVIFSLILAFLVVNNGLSKLPNQGSETPFRESRTQNFTQDASGQILPSDTRYTLVKDFTPLEEKKNLHFVKLQKNNLQTFWLVHEDKKQLEEVQSITTKPNGEKLYNGAPKENGLFYPVGSMAELDSSIEESSTGRLNAFSFIENIKNGSVKTWRNVILHDGEDLQKVYYPLIVSGKDIISPGLKFKVDSNKGATLTDKLNFVSLMFALLLGTASLPHILIRYYTVPSPQSARKSTIVAIFTIGIFYILTLYIGLGAMTNGVLDLTNENMSAPLLAKPFGVSIFSMISAIAFATVLGTVSGLILAASGAVAHDICDRFLNLNLTDEKQVWIGKIAAIAVGCIAMVLGILFKNMNVSFLVGWAFAIAASANLPAIIMILFWKKTTAQGVAASVFIGLVSALTLILLSQETFDLVYKIPHIKAPMPISNPAIFTVPLSFISLMVVSLLTQNKSNQPVNEAK